MINVSISVIGIHNCKNVSLSFILIQRLKIFIDNKNKRSKEALHFHIINKTFF